MKKFCVSAFILIFLAPLFSQKVGLLQGPSALPASFLMDKTQPDSIDFQLFPSAQQLLPKLIKGEIDIGFLPPNAAAKAFNATGKIIALGITGNGNIYLITKDSAIKSLKDLEGKKVACAGMGATPEYISRYLFQKNKIKNVELDFSTPTPQIPTLLSSGKFDCAIVPEPFATASSNADSSIKKALNLQEEYKLLEGKDFPMTLLVVNSGYLKTSESKVKDFIKKYRKSLEKTLKQPEKAGLLAEKAGLGLKAAVASKAIPGCSFTWKSSSEGKTEILSLLSLFNEFSPEAVGGKLPDDAFFAGTVIE